ncbi:MAG: tRNA uridine-5-carboxymethylaminomethyl(34) synthesis enzyme MnmG [Candidatus Omnitrophica bacterium]|nr:tRNA uridine-5-carboxymethylaminomethyl(34) synthesis enzyme MnmG [Candidatus Omnitrophota bacterium]
MKTFGCIVIGAGHAGIEAALAPARMGTLTLMLSYSFDTVGQMSCNPAIGGVGKGQLVREVDVLGGEMGLAADTTGIQFRRLNASKGPAVHSSRCQSDRERYRAYMQAVVKNQPNLTFQEGEAAEIVVSAGRVTGVRTVAGEFFAALTVIVTSGTFLNGRMHVGRTITPGGRIGEKPSLELARCIADLGFELRNFKTGTPARLDGRTIDYSRMQRQDSDEKPLPFSYRTPGISADRRLLPCWITHTTDETHRIIRENFHLSPMYSGQIDATGVRYCPSIEDKLKKFGDRSGHHVFLEPDGLDTPIIYPNGISTGLPEDVQVAFVRTIPGLERAEFIRYGYSIEHAVIRAEELSSSLESKRIAGLFFAGQVNGTTGYEEAAAQGLMAGINAALLAQGREPFVLGRDEAYLGVLIDDLITRGTNEPYRMFTSRVEYRLLVRENNTDWRLARHAHRLGLMSDAGLARVEQKYRAVEDGIRYLRERRVTPADINDILTAAGSAPAVKSTDLLHILRRPGVSLERLAGIDEVLRGLPAEVAEHVEYEVKYEGFIDRQKKEVEKFRHLENIRLPADLDYAKVPGISHEVRQKLSHFRPATLGQANRISGITPAAISVLMVYLRRFFEESRGGTAQG